MGDIEQLSAKSPHQQFTCIAHAVDLRVTDLELSHDVAGIPGNTRDSQNDEEGAEVRLTFPSTLPSHSPMHTYGMIPNVATADGRDRTPRDTFSAAMTVGRKG